MRGIRVLLYLSFCYSSLSNLLTSALPVVPDAVESIKNIKDALTKNCLQIPGQCKNQSQAQAKKKALKEFLIKYGKTTEEVDQAFGKTLLAKQTLLNLVGLREVVSAADDGTWAGDQLLSTDQAELILESLSPTASSVLESADKLLGNKEGFLSRLNRVKRGPSYSFELYPGYKWTMPIPYYVDLAGFTPNEVTQLTKALSAIEARTCVRFTRLQTKPSGGGHFIIYAKLGGYGCGNSHIGMQQGGNPVALSTEGVCGKMFYGIVIHETLHCLGLQHEQNRYDREKYIKVHWGNVNPQYYDLFSMYNPNYYTPYGVWYNVMSIMHYPAYLSGGVVDTKKPVISTLFSPSYFAPRIGWMDTFTENDVELVNRGYCRGRSCMDANVGCGWHAANGLCLSNRAMPSTCPRSCNTCK